MSNDGLEVMDYGIPQFMEADVLKQFIFEGGIKADLTDLSKLKQLTTQATGVTSWRAEGIVHKKNEVYIDVVENVNVLLSSKGTIVAVISLKLTSLPLGSILRTDVTGQCHRQVPALSYA